MSSIMVAALFLLTLNISMASKKTQAKGEHFAEKFIYRNIKTDMDGYMMQNIHIL